MNKIIGVALKIKKNKKKNKSSFCLNLANNNVFIGAMQMFIIKVTNSKELIAIKFRL